MSLNVRACFYLVPALVLFGCSKEQRDQLADTVSQAKDKVASTASEVTSKANESVSAAKETVVADGQAKLKLDKDLSFSASYVNLIPLKGRGAVVQIRSYLDSKSESFPSYFFQANTTAASLNALSGQTLKGTLFIKRDKDDATWMSLPEQSVSLSLDSILDGKLIGRVVDGKLSSAKGQPTSVTGSFEAIIEGGLE